MRFVKLVQNTAHRHDLWQRENKIIVGVSGGPDSACLLHVLCFLAQKYDFSLIIAHVNYGLRGKDSEADEAFVRQLGEKYDLPVNVIRANKPKLATEEQMRDFRYAYFEKLRKKYDFDLIAVAHNRDDQVETVLMRIVRGAGLAGLSAMRAKNGVVIRPLLEISHQIILAYLKENKLKYRTDKSNKDIKYLRNKVRNRLLPYLERNFNPAIRETISRWSGNVADDYDLLEKCSKETKIWKKNGSGAVSFSVQQILALNLAGQKMAIRSGISEISGSTKGVSAAHIEEVCKILKSDKNKAQKTAFAGLNIVRKGDKLLMKVSR
jgi:tRNA(Ile)-lysidine synthase